MEKYDFVMAGGGLAGLSLAYQLCDSALGDSTILVLDSERPGSGERTWSFWSDRPVPFGDLASYSWSLVRFASSGFETVLDLEPFRYHMLRGEDYFSHVLDYLERRGNVTFRTETVLQTRSSGSEAAQVVTTESTYEGRWVFDSRFDPGEYVASPDERHHRLMQHFSGWVIETGNPVFDPLVPTLFDFNIPQHDEMRFVYVLPFAEDKALVEFTIFSAALLEDDEYTENLESYIERVLRPDGYRVIGSERGVIPMTDKPHPRRASDRVMNIGTRGGLVKASTGYAFNRVQQDTAAIVKSLETYGNPFAVPATRRGFATLDTMLLQIMLRRGALSERIFTALFRGNEPAVLLRFLDEQTTVLETMRIMVSVPWLPFILAWFRTKILGKV